MFLLPSSLQSTNLFDSTVWCSLQESLYCDLYFTLQSYDTGWLIIKLLLFYYYKSGILRLYLTYFTHLFLNRSIPRLTVYNKRTNLVN